MVRRAAFITAIFFILFSTVAATSVHTRARTRSLKQSDSVPSEDSHSEYGDLNDAGSGEEQSPPATFPPPLPPSPPPPSPPGIYPPPPSPPPPSPGSLDYGVQIIEDYEFESSFENEGAAGETPPTLMSPPSPIINVPSVPPEEQNSPPPATSTPQFPTPLPPPPLPPPAPRDKPGKARRKLAFSINVPVFSARSFSSTQQKLILTTVQGAALLSGALSPPEVVIVSVAAPLDSVGRLLLATGVTVDIEALFEKQDGEVAVKMADLLQTKPSSVFPERLFGAVDVLQVKVKRVLGAGAWAGICIGSIVLAGAIGGIVSMMASKRRRRGGRLSGAGMVGVSHPRPPSKYAWLYKVASNMKKATGSQNNNSPVTPLAPIMPPVLVIRRTVSASSDDDLSLRELYAAKQRMVEMEGRPNRGSPPPSLAVSPRPSIVPLSCSNTRGSLVVFENPLADIFEGDGEAPVAGHIEDSGGPSGCAEGCYLDSWEECLDGQCTTTTHCICPPPNEPNYLNPPLSPRPPPPPPPESETIPPPLILPPSPVVAGSPPPNHPPPGPPPPPASSLPPPLPPILPPLAPSPTPFPPSSPPTIPSPRFYSPSPSQPPPPAPAPADAPKKVSAGQWVGLIFGISAGIAATAGLIWVAVNCGSRKFSHNPRRDSRSGPDSHFQKTNTLFDDPSLSLRSKYAALSPRLLLPARPLVAGKAAAAAVPPPQQPAFVRNDSSKFTIPAIYSYPTRTELFSPLGFSSNRLQGVTWNANPLATFTAPTAAAVSAEPSVAIGGAGPSNNSSNACSGMETSNIQSNNMECSTRGWRSVAAAINSQSYNVHPNSNSDNSCSPSV
ncbi:hypothetical protein Ndes2526B_g06240 [Nannochloris sp. 'desiccata']